MSFNIKRFGYERVFEFTIKKLFDKKINCYVLFYFHDVNTHELKESKFFFIPKDLTLYEALLEIKMKHIFPNPIMETFYYTDNRTVVPKEFIVYDEPKDNQLTFDFN